MDMADQASAGAGFHEVLEMFEKTIEKYATMLEDDELTDQQKEAQIKEAKQALQMAEASAESLSKALKELLREERQELLSLGHDKDGSMQWADFIRRCEEAGVKPEDLADGAALSGGNDAAPAGDQQVATQGPCKATGQASAAPPALPVPTMTSSSAAAAAAGGAQEVESSSPGIGSAGSTPAPGLWGSMLGCIMMTPCVGPVGFGITGAADTQQAAEADWADDYVAGMW